LRKEIETTLSSSNRKNFTPGINCIRDRRPEKPIRIDGGNQRLATAEIHYLKK
jgi:hypothetical protein